MKFYLFLGALTFLVYGCREFTEAECLAGNHDLSLLQKWNPWNAVAHIENENSSFSINFCSQNNSIYWQKSEKEAVIVGAASETLTSSPNQASGGFRVDFTGDVCESKTNTNWMTSIEFKCGTTLGSPEFLSKNNCTFAFEWHTTLACKSVPHPAISEVPCYVYDEQNRKRDLSPLIKQVGGYLVDSDGDENFYINVCRDITPDGPTSSCPVNSSGCFINGGSSGGIDMGRADSGLELLTNDRLRLTYHNPVQQLNCHGYSPMTRITFVCPRESGRFGGSKDPVLISDTNCRYLVEWQTEYACEVDLYVSNGDCQFTYNNDGVDIDLQPLRDSPKSFFAEEMKENGGIANTYYVKVCGELDPDTNCGSDERSGVSVCQSPEDGNSRHSAGSSENFNLRYTDGEVVLTYTGGDVCNHNSFQRTSVITFKCNETAGDGIPSFISEVHCMYFFEWQTSHVCLEHSRDTTCRVKHGPHRFDLSNLVRERGGNWEALDGRHNHDSDNEGVYYINICADILPEDSRTTSCPPGASVCFVGHNGKAESLGRFKQSPEYDEGEIVLTYVDGDESASGSCTKTTVIRFICTPGDMESAPSLVRVTAHNCKYEFEWRTAAACPLARRTGENCRVFDDDAGFTFDLSPLTKEGGSHEVSHNEFDYFLNVCEQISGTACNEDDSIDSPGACQVTKDGSRYFTLGVANSTLEYFDGILKLSYMMGTPYNKKDDEEVAPNRQADIVFLCDMNQDEYGDIEYVAEADHAYTFKWYTKYACPQLPVECVIRDEKTHKQYDLSSLSKALEEDNWMYSDSSDPTNIRKYYINVCRPINPLPNLCGSFAAACQTSVSGNEEVESIRNLGVASSAPIVESEGNLLLMYGEGSPCANGQNRTQTKIHFRCRKGKLDSSPQLLGSFNDGCLFVFMWETEAACPISTSSGSDCTVEDENSGYVFNMKSLSFDPFYEPRSNDNSLSQTRINVCGKVKNVDCKNSNGETVENAGACIRNGEDWLALGEASNKLVYSDDGLLTLTYQGESMDNGLFKEAVITFICRHNISVSRKVPETVSCNGFDKCFFNFETPLACLPESVDCLVSDPEGNQYDLSPLAKDDGNWEAVDTGKDKEHVSYHINVCKPLYSVDPEVVSCPGGPIAACQTDSNAHTSSNLGYVLAMPEAAADGSLSIRYVGGDPCESNPSSQKSTRINFECSYTPGSPIFQTETEFCEYIFTWQTPAACPLKRETGSDCRVTVAELGYEFDLNSLYNSTKDYTVTSDKYTYTLNVCGDLVNGEGACEGTGGCQDTGSRKFNAGNANKKLVYDSGILKLNYTSGDTCHSVYERSTAINFVCDSSVKGNGHPVFIRETADCTYMFEWATPLACPPFEQVECSYRDEQAQFDLAPLSTMDDNYVVVPTEQKFGEVYYLTLCRSLMNDNGKRGSKCPINAAACMEIPGKDGTNSQYINLGQVSSGPTMEDGHLVIRYNSGDPCPSSNEMRSTVINFDCDPNAMGSLPQFSDSDNNCTYSFLWMTNLACDLGHEDEKEENCRVANPITGFEFDLKVLQNINSVNIYGHDQHIYNISICKKLEDSVCEDTDAQVGACQEQSNVPSPKHFSTGRFNKKVFFDDGVLSLQYNMGTPCHNSKYFRSTIINFVCPHEENSLGEPVFISESEDCTYYFSWHTSAACEEYIQCSVMNGTRAIDLSPLVFSRGYYIAKSLIRNPKSTYVNLCRPLNPIQGTLCPPNAAVCQINDGKPESLGRLEHGPQIDDNGKVFIEYTNGAVCAEEPARNVSSVITFDCRKGEEKGVPTLVDYQDCTYHFNWETYVVCPPASTSKGEDCTYRNDVMEYIFDLTSLARKTYDMSAANQKRIRLHLCGSVDNPTGECEDAAVCLEDDSKIVSLGQATSQEFSFQGGNLKLTYRDGSPCPGDENEKRETTILFMCIDSKQSEDPSFFTADEDYCHTTLQWNTPIACPPPTMPCIASTPNQDGFFDLQPLSQITGSWTTKDSNQNTYFINVCKPALNTPSGCPNEASACRFQKFTGVEVLGMIYTQTLEYSEDSKGVLLTYSEGKVYTCDSNVSRVGYDSRVEVLFKCGAVVGIPVFEREILEDGICTFKFSWTSKVACQVEKAPVSLKDGIIQDPETGEDLDLKPLITGGQENGAWLVKGDDRGESANSLDVYKYYIMLDDKPMEIHNLGQECDGAAVCQTKEDERFFRNIGLQSNKIFYLEDETLELVTRNPGSCRKDQSDVLSTIIFQCDPGKTPGNPEFSYESGNCQYFFRWPTSHVCQSQHLPPDDGDSSHNSSPSKGGSFGKVVLAFLIVVFICVLIIVFHKRERRSAMYFRVRKCFPGAYSNVPTYSYSQLSTGDNIDPGASESRGLFDSDGEDEEIIKETRPNPLEYKDDSDEDLLIDSRV